MKAKVLMIGDWASLFQGNPDGTNCNVQVTFVGEYGEVGIEGCEEYTSANCNLLFPIPLTPEILEKNGWSKDLYNNESYDNDDFEQLSLWEGADGNAWWWHVGVELVVPLNFVHELQHALRLCGINKEIEI